MGIWAIHNVDAVHHFAPLHYLPFIARSQQLRNKSSLAGAGFPRSHLRSTSNHLDVDRGFGAFTHLTLHPGPAILAAKLDAGFPHVGLLIPADALESTEFELCRYNIAKTRTLRRGGKDGYPESATNGRYYGQQQIPTARTDRDKAATLAKHVRTGAIIEVLVRGDLPLPASTTVVCYSEPDEELARRILTEVGSVWQVKRERAPEAYPRNTRYAAQVAEFVDRALADPDWRGNGLEFDDV